MSNRLSRDSRIELLRIILMFFILIIHANFLSLPMPSRGDLTEPTEGFIRFFLESLGICAVNCFIFISGWFGIKPSLKGIAGLVFQVLFIWGGIYLLLILTGQDSLTLKGIEHTVLFTDWDWFIKAYIVLYIFSPVLNSFLNTVDEKTCRIFIIIAFLFQSTYGYLGGSHFYGEGYGPLTFFFLYVVAGYLRRVITNEDYCPRGGQIFLRWSKAFLGVYFLCVVLLTLGATLLWIHYGDGFQEKTNAFFAYINPIIVVESICLFLAFYYMPKFSSKVVNYIAQSSFAVFLLHSEIHARELFNTYNLSIYTSNSGMIRLLYIAFFLILVYITSILVDQVRLLIWRPVSNMGIFVSEKKSDKQN